MAGLPAFGPSEDQFSQPPYTGLCYGHAERHIAADAESPTGFPLLPL